MPICTLTTPFFPSIWHLIKWSRLNQPGDSVSCLCSLSRLCSVSLSHLCVYLIINDTSSKLNKAPIWEDWTSQEEFVVDGCFLKPDAMKGRRGRFLRVWFRVLRLATLSSYAFHGTKCTFMTVYSFAKRVTDVNLCFRTVIADVVHFCRILSQCLQLCKTKGSLQSNHTITWLSSRSNLDFPGSMRPWTFSAQTICS